MASYVFSWNNETWKNWAQKESGLITYVAGKNARPTSHFEKGDEIFVVCVKNHRLYVGGNLIVEKRTTDIDEAKAALSSDSVIKKDIYILGDKTYFRKFHSDVSLDAPAVRELEFIDDGRPYFCKFTDAGWMQDFRVPRKLADASAKKLRDLLSISEASVDDTNESHLEKALEEAETTENVAESRRLQAIKTRRGQADFRRRLLKAYHGQCCITGCNAEAVLEAAHIRKHAEETDYSTTNGLLLRADIHTLFDLNLLKIDYLGRVIIDESLKDTEYWALDGKKIAHPVNRCDYPGIGEWKRYPAKTNSDLTQESQSAAQQPLASDANRA